MGNEKMTNTQYDYIVAIGVSTGGPKALSKVIPELEQKMKATYIIVQHMPPGFTHSLAKRLDQLSEVSVKEACDGDILERGHVYIAPGGKHLKVTNSYRPTIVLTDEEPYKGHKPSVNGMLESLAKLSSNKKVIAIIMTGMGTDGLEGMKHLKEHKHIQVIAQDEKTSIVYGMPKAIINEGLANHIVPLQQIANTIKNIMGE